VTWPAAVLAAVLVTWASAGYIRQVARRDPAAHPRLASWGIWACSMGLAAAAAGQPASAVLAAAGAVTATAVLACGWVHGDRQFGRLDAAGTITGGCGLILLATAAARPGLVAAWLVVAVSVLTDLAAFTPVFANAAAGREPAGVYVKLAAAAAVTLAATRWDQPAGVIFPAYELAACTATALLAAAVTRKGWSAAG